MKQEMKKFIVPSIDLLSGKVVRLFQGNYNKKTEYDVDLMELLKKYQRFSRLHIVDLNCARGENNKVNNSIITTIIQNFQNTIQIGGGIRNKNDVKNKLKLGFGAVVIGTMAVKNIDLTKEIINTYGKTKIILSFDCKLNSNCISSGDLKNYYVKINGWQEDVKLNLFEVLQEYCDIAKTILITDISADGTMNGANVDLYRQIKNDFPNYTLQASGGISSVEDIKNVMNVADNVIIGKALYNGLIDMF